MHKRVKWSRCHSGQTRVGRRNQREEATLEVRCTLTPPGEYDASINPRHFDCCSLSNTLCCRARCDLEWRLSDSYAKRNMPVLRLLRRFSTWRYPHLLLSARNTAPAAIDWYLLQTPALSSKPAGRSCCPSRDRQTDTRPLHRPCTKRTA